MKQLFRIIFVVFVGVVYLGAFVGCSQNGETIADQEKPSIAVSIVPQETFVKAIAGELIDVVTMIPPGASPETYTPTPQQLQRFTKSSLYFAIGVPSEEANILPKAKELNQKMKVVNLSEVVAEQYPDRFFQEEDHDEEEHQEEDHDEEEHHHSGRDPHIWLSPKRVKAMIQVMVEEISTLDPENKEIYEENGKNYIQQVEQADKNIRDTLEIVDNKTFICFHPAFGYFADEYGLEMITIEKEGKEATAEHMQEVIDIAKEKNIRVIFNQAEFDTKQAQAIAEEIQGEVKTLEPLAPDYIENLHKMAEAFSNQ